MMDAFVQRLPRPRPPTPSRSPSRPSPLGERPAKKVKVEIQDSDCEDDECDVKLAEEDADTSGITVNDVSDEEGKGSLSTRQTHIESTLPPIHADKEAIEEYELMKSSQAGAPDDEEKPVTANRQWVRGKSSIYVDAFNLALETVLADESHLFDAKERTVFEQWESLDYEAQYLYVGSEFSCFPRLMTLPVTFDCFCARHRLGIVKTGWVTTVISRTPRRPSSHSRNRETFQRLRPPRKATQSRALSWRSSA